MTDAAVFLRVSSGEQNSKNQEPEVARLVKHRRYRVTRRYVVSDSAWEPGPEYKAELARLLADAHAGRFEVLVVWAADRLTREGIEPLLKIVRQLRERGVAIVSVQESWLDTTSPAVAELLLAIMAWVAEQESARRSERIKAGQARRIAEDPEFRLGRQAGAVDKKSRKRSGYLAAWEPGGKRRA